MIQFSLKTCFHSIYRVHKDIKHLLQCRRHSKCVQREPRWISKVVVSSKFPTLLIFKWWQVGTWHGTLNVMKFTHWRSWDYHVRSYQTAHFYSSTWVLPKRSLVLLSEIFTVKFTSKYVLHFQFTSKHVHSAYYTYLQGCKSSSFQLISSCFKISICYNFSIFFYFQPIFCLFALISYCFSSFFFKFHLFL